MFYASNELYAQCCSAGNPASLTGEMLSLEKRTLLQSLQFRNSYSDAYYSGSMKSDDGYIDHSLNNYFEYKLSYAFSNKIALSGEIGYFINKKEVYKNSLWPYKNGYGLGDAKLLLKYSLFKDFFRKYEIAAALGATLPVGVFDQVVSGVKLPITLQPSSGSFKYNFDLYYFNEIRGTKFKLLFINRFEIPQLIDSKNFYYQYGILNLSSFYASYLVKDHIALLCQFRNEYRGRAKRENDVAIESTGGDILFSSLGFSWVVFDNFNMVGAFDYPFYKNLNGTQLSNKYVFTLKVSYKIKLKDNES